MERTSRRGVCLSGDALRTNLRKRYLCRGQPNHGRVIWLHYGPATCKTSLWLTPPKNRICIEHFRAAIQRLLLWPNVRMSLLEIGDTPHSWQRQRVTPGGTGAIHYNWSRLHFE